MPNKILLFTLLTAQIISMLVLAFQDIKSMLLALDALIHSRILLILLNILIGAMMGYVLSKKLPIESLTRVCWISLFTVFLNGYFGLYLGEYLYASLPLLAGIYELTRIRRVADETSQESSLESVDQQDHENR